MNRAVSGAKTRFSNLFERAINCESGNELSANNDALLLGHIDEIRRENKDLTDKNKYLSYELNQVKEQLQSLQQEYEMYKRNSLPLPVEKSDRLPTVAPILYKDWKKLPENKGKTPLDCLREVYGKYLENSLLFQDDLRGKNGLDPGLMNAATKYCARYDMGGSRWYPPTKSQRLRKAKEQITDVKKAYRISNLAHMK